MKASERIKLKKEIIQRLSQESSWNMLQATLEEFGITVSHFGYSDMQDYLLQALKDTPDSILIELAEHVEYPLLSGAVMEDPAFWKKGNFRVFLSHLAKYKLEAKELQEELLQYGISSFVAHEDIEPTKEWQNEIELALQSCDCLVALMRPAFHESNWTDQEIGWALGRQLLVVPVRKDMDPYGFIGSLQAVPGHGKSSPAIASALLSIFLKHDKTSAKMTRVLAEKLAKSENWSDSKMLIGALEQTVYWESELSKLLEEAIDKNYEVSNSFGVPDRIKSLISKFSN